MELVRQQERADLTDEELHERFVRLDTDQTGTLNLKELNPYIRTLLDRRSRRMRRCCVCGDETLLFVALVVFSIGFCVPPLAMLESDDLFTWDTKTQLAVTWIASKAFAYFLGLLWAIQTCSHTMQGKPSRYARALVLWMVFLVHVQEASKFVIAEELQETAASFVTGMLALSVLATWFGLLDQLQSAMMKAADEQAAFNKLSKPVRKWQLIAKGFASWGPGKEWQDASYNLYNEDGEPACAAAVLAEIGTYVIFIAKLLSLALVLLNFVGVSVYENIVFIGLSVIVTVMWTSTRLDRSVSAIIPMALDNPFYVGEIISLSRPGLSPADSPQQYLMGFVEALTWNHVVIRDFKKKQTFVPLPEFQGLVIANWTRRPAKLCYWYLCVSSQPKDGEGIAKLARWARQWIKAHDKIDHKGYTKAVVKGRVTDGLALEIVFYPRVGANVHQLRAEFVVALMAAARILDLSIVPKDLKTPFPEDFSTAAGGAVGATPPSAPGSSDKEVAAALAGLMPTDPSLARRAGYA